MMREGVINHRIHRAIIRLWIHLVLLVLLLAFLMPVLWMLSTALKPASQVLVVPPQWIPKPIRLMNFVEMWRLGNFGRGLINSSIITFGAMLGIFFSGPMVAFGFARLRFFARDALFVIVLATLMLPAQVTLIPLYVIYKYLRWLDTFYPFIVPAFMGGGAFYIFLLRQFFLTIPFELEDAARIDGCGTWRIFLQIFLPLSKPALATVGIFSFINGWNAYFGPLVFLSSPEKMPVTVVLATFKDVQGGI